MKPKDLHDQMMREKHQMMREKLDWLRFERDHLLMEQAIVDAVKRGVFFGNPNFNWHDLTMQ